MPIITQCPQCGKKLKAPDEHAGRQAKCPQCKNVFRIGAVAGVGAPAATAAAERGPAPSPASGRSPAPAASPATAGSDQWYVQTAEGQEYGPVTKAELDQWLAEDRLDAECQVLQEGWDQWKWAEDVYPQLAGGAAAPANDNPFAGFGEQPAGVSENPFAGVGEQNPYASPASGGPGGGVAPSAGGDAAITQRMVRALEGTRPWVLMFAILSFIGCAGLIIPLILSLITLFANAIAGFIMLLWTGAYLGLLGYSGYLQLTYSNACAAFARNKSPQQLEKALEAQQKFWKFAGICTLVAIGLSVLFSILFVLLVGSLIAGLSGAASGGGFP